MNARNERDAHAEMADSYRPHTPVWIDEPTDDHPERMLTAVILAAVFAIGACAGWLAFALTHSGLALTG